MGRQLRRYRHGALYEATLKTFQARFFFVPSKWLNLLLVGVLAYAQEKYDLGICYIVAMTNHIHILFRGADAQTVSDFFCLANGHISKEAQALCGWTGGVLGGRFKVVEITDEPEAQIARLKYLMSQGLKEGLVPHPTDWPGVQSAQAWLDGSMELRGIWVNRSDLYELERAGRRSIRARMRWLSRSEVKKRQRKVPLTLSPLPCMDSWSKEEVQVLARRLCEELLDEHAETRRAVRKGWRKRLTDPSLLASKPETTKKGALPIVHAASGAAWVEWTREWRSWVRAYRSASQRLRSGSGVAMADFPDGCFIPSGSVLIRSGRPPPCSGSV